MRVMTLSAALLLAACGGDPIPSHFSIVSDHLQVRGDNGYEYEVDSTAAPAGGCFITITRTGSRISTALPSRPIPDRAWIGFPLEGMSPDQLIVHCVAGKISGEITKTP